MAFYPLEDLPVRPGDPGTTPTDYVKKFIGQHPELVPDSPEAAAKGVPSGPVGGKRSRAKLALQGLRGIGG